MHQVLGLQIMLQQQCNGLSFWQEKKVQAAAEAAGDGLELSRPIVSSAMPDSPIASGRRIHPGVVDED